jgi:hypothetical protein
MGYKFFSRTGFFAILFKKGLKLKKNSQFMNTLSLRPKNSRELMIASAGARYTKDGPYTSGSLVPTNMCSNVVIPVTSNTVDTTAAMSS